MHRFVVFALILLACAVIVAPCRAGKGPEVIDPQVARQAPDFLIQGEYLGNGTWEDGKKVAAGAQVIAQGNDTFRVVVYRGGLPGDGWNRGDPRLTFTGQREIGGIKLKGAKISEGRIAEGKLTVRSPSGGIDLALDRIERSSPTLGAEPSQGAIVLFDGTNVDHFPDGKISEMKTLEAGCTMKGKYKIARLHLEFRLSWKPTARGQGRSNSGVYIGGIPEIQVLDSFGLEGAKNECGALYGRRPPDVNMCFPPMTWQTYDVEFRQPTDEDSSGSPGHVLVTVRHNGVIVHEDYDTRKKEWPLSRLHLQRHGNRVQYRNIWLLPQP